MQESLPNTCMPIHIFGKCGNLNCPKGKGEISLAEEYKSQLRRHKFYLAFKNSLCKDYITEKYWKNTLQNGLVPIVLGGGGHYIDVKDFQTEIINI